MSVRPTIIVGLIAVTAALAGSVVLVATADAEPACRIGRPSYCIKYGGGLCEKRNGVADAAAACAAWTNACLDCHAAIPTCFGGKRPSSASELCARCRADWTACMKAADAKHWPSRRNLAK